MFTFNKLFSIIHFFLHKHLNLQVVRDIVSIYKLINLTSLLLFIIESTCCPNFIISVSFFGFPGDALSIKIHSTVYIFFFSFQPLFVMGVVMVVIA